jgi:4-aminobutyrate aminotransferase
VNAPNGPSVNAQLQARKEAATPRGVAVLADFYVDRAENAALWDVEGRRFIDFAGGIAVLNVGHRHPKVLAAVREQLERFTHTCYQVVPYEGYVALAERLNRLTPGAHAKKTAFFSTGAEAVENAVKVARAATGRSGVIAFAGAFHGRTHMALALTGKVVPYKAGLGPFPADVYHAPFPCHCVSTDDALAGLQHLFKAEIDPQRVAAIIVEPVQGEGGFYIAPKRFVQALRSICDDHGMLLIADEIQTGFARTGRWFAMEHYDVVPDLMAMAKSLAGGFPLCAITGRAEIMDAPAPGGMGGTYAGSPVAIAAAHAVIDVIEQESLVARSVVLGERLAAFLREQPPLAGDRRMDVRALGSMVAAEFLRAGGEPDADFAKRVQQAAMRRGLLILTCGTGANVIRFLYPLTIPDALFEEGMQVFAEALRESTAA